MRISYLLVGLALFISCKQDPKSIEVESKKDEVKVTKEDKTPISKLEMSSYDTKIELGNVDYNVLKSLLLEKINEERKKNALTPFTEQNNLVKAAFAHNQYMISNDILTHDENNENTSDVMKRVNIAGGQFNRVGENVQFSGFTVRTYNGQKEVIAPSYIEAAEDLFENWKNSPGHYRNLIDNKFNYCGTSIGWSSKKNALFATQVYGG